MTAVVLHTISSVIFSVTVGVVLLWLSRKETRKERTAMPRQEAIEVFTLLISIAFVSILVACLWAR